MRTRQQFMEEHAERENIRTGGVGSPLTYAGDMYASVPVASPGRVAVAAQR